jgi:hypothetical protein
MRSDFNDTSLQCTSFEYEQLSLLTSTIGTAHGPRIFHLWSRVLLQARLWMTANVQEISNGDLKVCRHAIIAQVKRLPEPLTC